MYGCESRTVKKAELATWCRELTYFKRPWCWERLRTGGEGDDRGYVWMASLSQWTWISVNSGSRWWTDRPGVLGFMRWQRVGRDWTTDLIWSDLGVGDGQVGLACCSQGVAKIQTRLSDWTDWLNQSQFPPPPCPAAPCLNMCTLF